MPDHWSSSRWEQKLGKKSCGGLRDDGEFKGCVSQIAGHINANILGLKYMLPACACEGNGEVVHVRMSMKRGGRNGQMHELHAGQRALNQFCHTFGGADFDELRRLTEDQRVSD